MQDTLQAPPVLELTRRSVVTHPLQQCHWSDFPVVHDTRGNLTVIEGFRQVPFDIKRLYYLYDIPSQAERGGHAHKELSQVIIAMSGSFDLHLDDGFEQRTIHLCRANRGYVIRPWVWRTLDNFSGNSVCLVITDRLYEEADYIRDQSVFLCDANRRFGQER